MAENKHKREGFEITDLSLSEDINFETQYMMSGDDTALIDYDVIATKEQLAALAERTDLIDYAYQGNRKMFAERLFDDTLNLSVKAELRSNVYCPKDDRAYMTARLLVECDDYIISPVCNEWEVNLTDDEQYALKSMMEECANGLSLETLIHYAKQASLEDIALRNAQNGMPIITDLAVIDGIWISGMDTKELSFLVYELTLDDKKTDTLEMLRNRCVWEYNADSDEIIGEEKPRSISLVVTITDDNTEMTFVERAEKRVQSFNVPITQEEKDLIKAVVVELDTKQMKYTDFKRLADGSYNLRLSEDDMAVFVGREPDFKGYGAHPYNNLILETDVDFYINVKPIATDAVVATLCMESNQLGNKEFPLNLSHNERRALMNTVMSLETEKAKDDIAHTQNETTTKKTRNKSAYER